MGSGAETMRDALARGAIFDALVAANDGMALGAMQVLREHGVRVPEQVSVTGFDDLVLARFTNPPLTTIRQPIERMAALSDRPARPADGEATPVRRRHRAFGRGRPAAIVRLRTGRRFAVERPRHVDDRSARALSRASTPRLRERVGSVLHCLPARSASGPASLVDALRAELAGEKGSFNAALERVMHETPDRVELHEELQAVVTLASLRAPDRRARARGALARRLAAWFPPLMRAARRSFA